MPGIVEIGGKMPVIYLPSGLSGVSETSFNWRPGPGLAIRFRLFSARDPGGLPDKAMTIAGEAGSISFFAVAAFHNPLFLRFAPVPGNDHRKAAVGGVSIDVVL